MSEEIAAAAADLATVEALRVRVTALEADNAGLLGIVWDWESMNAGAFADRYGEHDSVWTVLRTRAHPGAALLAELVAARAFIATARELGIDWDAKEEERVRWLRDLHAYDKTTNAT